VRGCCSRTAPRSAPRTRRRPRTPREYSIAKRRENCTRGLVTELDSAPRTHDQEEQEQHDQEHDQHHRPVERTEQLVVQRRNTVLDGRRADEERGDHTHRQQGAERENDWIDLFAELVEHARSGVAHQAPRDGDDYLSPCLRRSSTMPRAGMGCESRVYTISVSQDTNIYSNYVGCIYVQHIKHIYGRSGETSRDIGDILDSYQEITSINPNTNLNWLNSKIYRIDSRPALRQRIDRRIAVRHRYPLSQRQAAAPVSLVLRACARERRRSRSTSRRTRRRGL